MKDSKSNGMNWTGSIYHKFERIVPEVNDIMIQDTLKYVENHVHSVGGTFKKFCSGVVQDFFPLSADPIKCEAKVVAPEGNAAISTDKCNSVINTVQVSSDATLKQSPVEIDAVDHADKHLDYISTKHHDEDKLGNLKSTDIHEDPDPIPAAGKNNVLPNEDSSLSNNVDSIEESADGPLEDTFKYVEDHGHAVGGALKKFCSDAVQDFFPPSVDSENREAEATTIEGDATVAAHGNSKSVTSMVEDSSDVAVEQSPVVINAIDHFGKPLDHACTGHEKAGEFKNEMSPDSHENLDFILEPGRFDVLTIENSDLGNGVDAIKDYANEQLELNSESVMESLETLTVDILVDETECDFGRSSCLSETTFSVVSGEDTIKGTVFVSSSSSTSRDSTNTPGYSSDISSPEECVSDSHKRLLSSIPASTMSTEDGAIEKQLVSSCSHLSVELNDDSGAVVPDSGMETIDLCDEAKLGESCVFLDDTVLHDVSRRARKLGSYKKKIQDMFTSKKRRAKEYEQLAVWYGDADVDLSQNAPFDSQNLQTRHASDSEWELL